METAAYGSTSSQSSEPESLIISGQMDQSANALSCRSFAGSPSVGSSPADLSSASRFVYLWSVRHYGRCRTRHLPHHENEEPAVVADIDNACRRGQGRYFTPPARCHDMLVQHRSELNNYHSAARESQQILSLISNGPGSRVNLERNDARISSKSTTQITQINNRGLVLHPMRCYQEKLAIATTQLRRAPLSGKER